MYHESENSSKKIAHLIEWIVALTSPSPSGEPGSGCVEAYFEVFVRIYDEHFSRWYGFLRPYLNQVLYRLILLIFPPRI